MNISRRTLLRMPGKPAELRPPWLQAPTLFTDNCTRCNQCIEHCPEHIITAGHDGYPSLDFSRGECTFCGACTQHCEADLFSHAQPLELPAWEQTATISAHCLAYHNVMCRSCEDACEPAAIRFRPTIGNAPQPVLAEDLCTGCGACIRRCPEHAITINQTISTHTGSTNTGAC